MPDRKIAIVMAGGEGTRLRPLTIHRPKPLVPVGNRPLMAHTLRHLLRHGFWDIIATVHYQADEIEAQFGDGGELGMSIQYAMEETPLGTAGSVRNAISPDDDGPILIVSGDALTDCDFSAALAYHQQQKAAATIVLARVPDPKEFGIVVTNATGRVHRHCQHRHLHHSARRAIQNSHRSAE